MTNPLSDLNPTSRFSDRTADYVKHRPSYPRQIIDAVIEGLGEPESLHAADIGAGTGISSRLLADRGVNVAAVEPNHAMREACAANPHPRITLINASAEATTLPNASQNAVFCAQAFHWFKPDAALAEFRRILKPRGRCAIAWNLGDDADPVVRRYYDIVFNASDEARAVSTARHYDDPFAARTDWSPEPVIRASFVESYDLEALFGRARSASYVPRQGPAWERVRTQLESLWQDHQAGGRIAMTYRCTLFRARPI